MSWSELPPAPSPRPRPPLSAAVVLTVVPIAVESARLEGGGRWPWVIVPMGAIAVLVGAARPRWGAIAFPVAGIALASILGGGDGVKVAVLTVVGGVIWGVGLGVVRWAPERLDGGRALRPALLPLAVADLSLLVGPTLRVPLALTAAAVAAAAIGAIAPRRVAGGWRAAEGSRLGAAAGRVSALVDGAARIVGRSLLWVSMIPGAIAVTVIGLLQRVVGHDPLGAPTARPGTWVVRSGPDPYPERYYSSGAVVDRRSRRSRIAGVAAPVVAIALLAGLVVLVDRDEPRRAVSLTIPLTTDGPCTDPSGATSLSGSELLECETGAALGHLEFYAPSVFRIADFAGETVNETDGVRRTWRPPACDCPRLDVWWFGGSAAWGEGQSDLHTLPSELARAAYADGVALDISNFAQTTYTLGQEVRMFSDLTTRRPAPDLVVFYDGGNDLVFQGQRARAGRADDESPIVLVEQQLDDLLGDGFPIDPDRPTTTEPPTPVVDDELIARTVTAAMNRYGRDADLARRIGASIDVPVSIVFQPLLAGSSDRAAEPGVLPPEEVELFERFVEGARARLPDDVIDLSSAFAEVDEPVFIDLFHTNERGAELLGRRLASALAPEFRSVSGGSSGR